MKVNRPTIHNFRNGMTVRELRQLVLQWPEVDEYGDDREVWMEVSAYLSSPVTKVIPLNLREDNEGNVSADLLLGSDTFTKEN